MNRGTGAPIEALKAPIGALKGHMPVGAPQPPSNTRGALRTDGRAASKCTAARQPLAILIFYAHLKCHELVPCLFVFLYVCNKKNRENGCLPDGLGPSLGPPRGRKDIHLIPSTSVYLFLNPLNLLDIQNTRERLRVAASGGYSFGGTGSGPA